jgi:hypothetical protein
MTDGDVSHSYEKRLGTYTKGAGLDLSSLRGVFLRFYFVYVYFQSDVYFLTSGALSPEWVKPTAEGGGLSLLVVFLLYFLFFFKMLSYCFFSLRACVLST